MPRVFIGTSGWIYPHWRTRFYPGNLPPSQWLRYYSSFFDTVEINNSFYRLPDQHVFQKWAGETGDDFIFSVKASRYLTHMKKLKDPADPLNRILANSAALAGKRGPILYQLPPNWRANYDRLEGLLQMLPQSQRHVFEFRDDSWQNKEIWELLSRYNAGCCIMDAPGLLTHLTTTSDFSYIRMHSGENEGDYSQPQLRKWAEIIKGLLAKGDVYIYFNNDQNGYAIGNAMDMGAYLRESPQTDLKTR